MRRCPPEGLSTGRCPQLEVAPRMYWGGASDRGLLGPAGRPGHLLTAMHGAGLCKVRQIKHFTHHSDTHPNMLQANSKSSLLLLCIFTKKYQ
jgi:hypothetical protein